MREKSTVAIASSADAELGDAGAPLATLDTIFTDREVKVAGWRTESPSGVFWPPPASVNN